jgi:starch phosphorylase
MTVDDVAALWAKGYQPGQWLQANPRLAAVMDLIANGHFSGGDTQLFQPLVDGLVHHDPYMLFADFQSYLDCQAEVDATYLDVERWTRMSILNTARSGRFSSDRSIRQYAAGIWQLKPVPVKLLTRDQVRSGVLQ